MKKNGFTLAEVLITLAIIGVVATITLPALMSNTQEQQAITAFRKSMNTLNEVGQLNTAVDGFSYGTVDEGADAAPDADPIRVNGVLAQTVWGMMADKAQVDTAASADNAAHVNAGGCQGLAKQIFFRDGTVLCYGDVIDANTGNQRFNAIVDTNGRKAPNRVASCDDDTCTTNKSITDQFRVTLMGSNAIPGHVSVDANGVVANGADNEDRAARWAMIR